MIDEHNFVHHLEVEAWVALGSKRRKEIFQPANANQLIAGLRDSYDIMAGEKGFLKRILRHELISADNKAQNFLTSGVTPLKDY
jgi:hypothetical protein